MAGGELIGADFKEKSTFPFDLVSAAYFFAVRWKYTANNWLLAEKSDT